MKAIDEVKKGAKTYHKAAKEYGTVLETLRYNVQK